MHIYDCKVFDANGNLKHTITKEQIQLKLAKERLEIFER